MLSGRVEGFRNTFANAARDPSFATAPIDAGGGSVGASTTTGEFCVGVARAMTIDPSIDASKSGGRSRSGECKGAVHFSSRAGSILMRFFGRSLIRLLREPLISLVVVRVVRPRSVRVVVRAAFGASCPRRAASRRAASSTLRGLNGCRGAAICGFMGVLGGFLRAAVGLTTSRH